MASGVTPAQSNWSDYWLFPLFWLQLKSWLRLLLNAGLNEPRVIVFRANPQSPELPNLINEQPLCPSGPSLAVSRGIWAVCSCSISNKINVCVGEMGGSCVGRWGWIKRVVFVRGVSYMAWGVTVNFLIMDLSLMIVFPLMSDDLVLWSCSLGFCFNHLPTSDFIIKVFNVRNLSQCCSQNEAMRQNVG